MKTKYKVICDGGGFTRESHVRTSLESARKVALKAFELKFHTRHKRAAIFSQTLKGEPWTLVEKHEYKKP